MLKIQDNLTFKDVLGRVYKTDRMILPLRNQVEVYSVMNNDHFLLVRFPEDLQPSERTIQNMCDCDSNAMVEANILWPERMCYRLDSDAFCGYLAKAISIPIEQYPLDRLLSSCRFDMVKRLTVGLNLAKCIHAIHQTPKHYAMGVLRPEEFHVAQDGQVLVFCPYRCILPKKEWSDSIFAPPEWRMMQKAPSCTGDAFSYGMILFQLLTETLPFGAHEPQTRFTDAQITDMILNGESIYYYPLSPQSAAINQRLLSISPELSKLFRLTFDYCGLSQYDETRPSMVDWINVLEKILHQMSQ